MKTKIKGLSVAALLALGFGAPFPAQAQISASFTNTRPIVTSLGPTNVIEVERGIAPTTFALTMLTTLDVAITVDPGYVFDGFTVLTLPSNDSGNPLTNADVTQDAAFSSAVNVASNNPSAPFAYNGPLLDFQVRSSLPTGLYYKYALADPTQSARTFVRFQARNTSSGALVTQSMFYGVNVNEAGTLATAPEPASAALWISALPLVGLVARRERRA